VLTLEMFEGPTLSRIKPEELDAGVRQGLLEAGTDAVFRQCLEHGFFHADPHPGNLMILPDGRLGFVDCGMTGRIDEPTAQSLADLVSGVVAQDGDRVVEAAVSLAEADAAMLSDRRLRRTLEDLMLRLDAGSLERLNLGDLLRRFFDALREHRIQCPSDLLMLIKALTTIEGVAAWLDPSFDVVAHSRPHIERLIQRRYSPGALFQGLSRALHAYSSLLAGLPRDLQLLIERLRHNDLRLRIDHVGLRRLTVTLEYSSRVVAFALVIAAIIVGSAILALADRTSGDPGVLTNLAIGGAGTAGILALLMALTHRRPRD
jgi:ubiquinone biosynthesis protein